MNFIKNFASGVSTVASKAIFKIKKFSPEILIGGGILAIATGTVLACVATSKNKEIIDNAEAKIEDIKDDATIDQLDEDEAHALIRKEKVKMVGRIITNYAVPAACITSGIAMILWSHGIMKKRQAMLLTAYNTLDAAFKKYRERVLADEDGENKDHRYLLGDDYPREDDGDRVMTDDEITDTNKRGRQLMYLNSPYGPYTFEFGRTTSMKWSPDSLSNLNTIRSAEEWGNRQLEIKGHLFLNDILDYIGLDKVPWGQLVGWVRGSERGDNFVRILAAEDRRAIELDDDCWKKPIFLEFNCDGAIWEDI